MELVTGGSGSGKSAYAEDRICALYEDCLLYTSTALDAAMQVRVIRLLKKIVKETNTALCLIPPESSKGYCFILNLGWRIPKMCIRDRLQSLHLPSSQALC